MNNRVENSETCAQAVLKTVEDKSDAEVDSLLKGTASDVDGKMNRSCKLLIQLGSAVHIHLTALYYLSSAYMRCFSFIPTALPFRVVVTRNFHWRCYISTFTIR